MPRRNTVLIRADAGGRIGTGHIMRMIALAQSLQDCGSDAVIASSSCPDTVAARVRAAGVSHQVFEGGSPSDATDLAHTVALAQKLGCEWVVLDGYHFGAGFQRAVRQPGFRVLCVDDFMQADPWECDAVLNQNLGAEHTPVQSIIEPFAALLGARYALLRREFHTTKRKSADTRSRGPLKRILVTLGGVDPDNVTGMMVSLLDEVRSGDLEIRVLVGAGNPHLAALRARRSRHHVEILVDVVDMPGQFAWADGVISAGGSTCWEWLLFGLPACTVTLADNQERVVEELSRRQLARSLGWFDGLESATVRALLEEWISSGLEVSSDGSEGLVDGWGGDRVAAFLAGCPLVLREATAGDLMTYFAWVNDPLVRASSFHSQPIELEGHKKWFQQRIDSDAAILLVAETFAREAVGQVRIERSETDEWELNFSLASTSRGRGLGGVLVAEALRRCELMVSERPLVIVGRVKPENVGSLRSLDRAGFRRSGSEDTAEGAAVVLRYQAAAVPEAIATKR